MRSILQIILVVGLTLSIFSNDVWGENLVKFVETYNGTRCYYDKDTLKRTSEKVSLWITIIYSEEEKKELLEDSNNKSIEKLNELSYSKSLWEINCQGEKYRVMTFIYYNFDGSVLYSHHPERLPSNWEYIIPVSKSDPQKKIVCK